MKRLPPKLKKNGFDYSKQLVCGNYYLYEQDYNSGIEDNEPGITLAVRCYEVFRAKVRPSELIKGKLYPEREVFPKDEDFGYTAWSIRDMGEALNKLMKLKGHLA